MGIAKSEPMWCRRARGETGPTTSLWKGYGTCCLLGQTSRMCRCNLGQQCEIVGTISLLLCSHSLREKVAMPFKWHWRLVACPACIVRDESVVYSCAVKHCTKAIMLLVC